MRLATATHDTPAIPAPLIFGFFGLASGLSCWQFGNLISPEWTRIGNEPPISPAPGLVFAVAIGLAAWLSGAFDDEEIGLATLLAALVAIPAWYWVVVKLLFFGYFSKLFDLPGWLNFGLCGLIGAVGIGVLASFFIRKSPGWIFVALPIFGLGSALASENLIFLFPWWQGSVAVLLGLWVTRD